MARRDDKWPESMDRTFRRMSKDMNRTFRQMSKDMDKTFSAMNPDMSKWSKDLEAELRAAKDRGEGLHYESKDGKISLHVQMGNSVGGNMSAGDVNTGKVQYPDAPVQMAPLEQQKRAFYKKESAIYAVTTVGLAIGTVVGVSAGFGLMPVILGSLLWIAATARFTRRMLGVKSIEADPAPRDPKTYRG